jgi:hypothetical protein
MVLGRMWFAEHDVLLDYRRHRMIWPDERTLFDEVASKISVPTPKVILQRSPQSDAYQKDTDRRDRLLEQS